MKILHVKTEINKLVSFPHNTIWFLTYDSFCDVYHATTLVMSLTADTGRLAPPDLEASIIPDSVDESTSNRHLIESADSRHSPVGIRRRQAARQTFPNSTSSSSSTTTREDLDSTAYPSAASHESVPRIQRHWTRQRLDDWFNTSSEEQQAVLDGFRERTQGHAAFNRLNRS